MAGVRASRPRFRRDGVAPRVELADDDTEILKRIFRHRFVRADDLYRLIPGRSKDRLSRRLMLLFRAEYLDRPMAQIDRYHEGGSRSFVYGLGNAGARYLKERGLSIGATDWRSRNRTYTRENLDHTLAISRFLIDLELACRASGNVSLIPFEDILAAAPEATRKSRAPMTWPVPIQWHGGKSMVQLAPDAIFGIRVVREDGSAMRAYFFLEIDRGTMTIVPSKRVRESEAFPYRATILRKFYAYADSYRLDLHKTQFSIKAPRILFLTNNERRSEAMRRTALQFVIEPMRLPGGLFLFGANNARNDLLMRSVAEAFGH